MTAPAPRRTTLIRPAPLLRAVCAALDLPEAPEPPEWIQLLPAGPEVETWDGRGPYRIEDLEAIAQASLADPRGILIDENHATDRDAASAPAVGWVRALEVRADGLWGRVAWTPQGEALIRSRAYRGISPVIGVDPDDARTVRKLLRAGLVNRPNLRGLAMLNTEDLSVTEDTTPPMAAIAEALGLPADADAEAVLEAIRRLRAAAEGGAALQSELGRVFGAENAAPAALAAAARAVQAAAAQAEALRSELATLRQAQARAEAEAFVEAEMRAGRAIPAPDRAAWVELFAEQPETARRLIAGLPKLGPVLDPVLGATAPAAAPGPVALNAEQRLAARLLGLSDETYARALSAARRTEEDA